MSKRKPPKLLLCLSLPIFGIILGNIELMIAAFCSISFKFGLKLSSRYFSNGRKQIISSPMQTLTIFCFYRFIKVSAQLFLGDIKSEVLKPGLCRSDSFAHIIGVVTTTFLGTRSCTKPSYIIFHYRGPSTDLCGIPFVHPNLKGAFAIGNNRTFCLLQRFMHAPR